MSATLLVWLDRSADALTQDLSSRLLSRAGTIFRAIGPDATRDTVSRLLSALRKDLAAEGDGEGRDVLGGWIEDLAPRGLGHYDLRLLTTSLRSALLAATADAPDVNAENRSLLESWLFQIALSGPMYLLVQRERVFQEQTAELEVRQMKAQLDELQAAYTDKTRLLEQIRQASTPIATVHEGILVVPLVGILDEDRAQALTEKLLDGIVGTQAQVVIVDVSGVGVFDAATAQHVLDTARATRLLGAELVLVGLSPAVARTVLELGVDLSGLSTQSSLAAGLARALGKVGLRIAPLAAPRPSGGLRR
ncbi:STAS domain-containing protein [Polyangium sp. y55x31]|uniref:STAS domain-containing protein n=1 Tax=Polyangium sp. y55x31 TaxID=3042688 RepID=UPI002482DB28|nr:STAS domain-containing protein [Polyangium sp. y55x31]MDI1481009.1 STAS domain-containing protein [Polyangium sp. y55x31]